MPKITKLHFNGAGNVYAQGEDGLSEVIRKMAQDLARTRINNFSDLTDNSTGSAVYPAALAAQEGKGIDSFTEAGTASASKSDFDTALGKVANAQAGLAEHMNRINASLGIDLIVDNTGGSVSTQGTIAAMDKSISGSAASLVDVTTGRTSLEVAKVNMARLFGAANRIAVAVGEDKMTSSLGQGFDGSVTLDEIEDTDTAVDGDDDDTISASDASTEFDAIADNVATISAFLNAITGSQLSDLTDSTGGTPSDTELESQAIPDAADGAATTSSPKAGFDTELGNIEDGLSELATQINGLLKRNNLSPVLTDDTGVTPNGTLPAIDTTLTAVDGSSGSDAVDVTTATDRMTKIANAISSIASKVNDLADVYGLQELTDNVGGTVSTTIANIEATGTGVGGGTDDTMLDEDVDAWLVSVANNLSTLAVKVNDMTGSDNTTDIPLQVVAWDA